MSSSIDRQSPHGLAAMLSVLTAGAGDFEGGVFKAMILGNANDLSDSAKWEAVASLDDGGYVLDEYQTSGGAVRRIAVTVNSVSTLGAEARVTIDAPVWPSFVANGNDPAHVLIYFQKALALGDGVGVLDLRVPIGLMNGVFTPDGTTFTAVQPAGGLLYIET